MKLYLPYDTRIKLELVGENVHVIFDTNCIDHSEDLHEEFLINRNDSIFQLMTVLDVTESGLLGEMLVSTLINDLLDKKSLDWFPKGFVYFTGKHIVVFSNKRAMKSYDKGEGKSIKNEVKYKLPSDDAECMYWDVRESFRQK